MPNRIFVILLLFLLIASCVPASPIPDLISPSEPKPGQWWRNAVFYEVFVRSFYDSDGNGIGDFNGITQQLDYIQSLGVTGLWLMPIFPSPSYHGYDVTDYYAVNPQYGTMEDFKRLIEEAHKRNIHIIIDLVINHTSDKHPWFKAAKDPNSPYRDWYIWSDTDPKYAGPWGERVWHPSANGYFYGIFEAFMPDLNYNNPAVTKEMKKIISFWLKDVGVDGFRLDAAKHLIEDGTKQENTAATHAWFKDEFYPTYKTINPNAVVVGELFGDGLNTIAGYVDNDQFDLAFNFQLAESAISSAQTGISNYYARTIKTTEKVLKNHNYATFLANHDQDRIMSDFGRDVNKAKVAASLMLTSPGIPFIYYGEEIGMVGTKPDENIRRPMQWTADANAGFTTGKPWRAPDSDFTQVNTAIEEDDPDSLLNHYRSLIGLRNGHSALRTGKLILLETGNSNLYAALRADQNETILVLINLTDRPISDYNSTLEDSLLSDGTYGAESLLGDGQVEGPTVSRGVFTDYKPIGTINPYFTLIVKLIP